METSVILESDTLERSDEISTFIVVIQHTY